GRPAAGDRAIAPSFVPRADGLDLNSELLPGEREVTAFDVVRGDEFQERLVLVFLPVREVEVLVEQDDGPGHDSLRQQRKDGASRTVEIAVDMDERHRPGIGVQPFRQRLLEPSRMQAHIGRNPREPSLYVERLIGEVEAGPHLRQALEAVEPMYEPAANPLGDEADGAAGIDPEFEIVAV